MWIKQSTVALCITLVLILASADGHYPCHLSEELKLCGGQSSESSDEADVKRVIVGPPGKQGPQGPPGELRNCNCTKFDEMQSKIDQLERAVSEMRRKFLV